MHPYKGIFASFDGPDGGGKGAMIDSLVEYSEDLGKKVFSLDNFWLENNAYPKQEVWQEFDVIISSEPTYWGVGVAIRDEIIRKNKPHEYSAIQTALAYALDREILHNLIIIPALKMGKHIFQSRCFASIAYQKVQANDNGEPWGFEDFMSLEGNVLASKYAPDFLFFPKGVTTQDLINRIGSREKQDEAQYETLEFLDKVRLMYVSEEFKNIFVDLGTVIETIDAGHTEESTKTRTVKQFKKLVEKSSKRF